MLSDSPIEAQEQENQSIGLEAQKSDVSLCLRCHELQVIVEGDICESCQRETVGRCSSCSGTS